MSEPTREELLSLVDREARLAEAEARNAEFAAEVDEFLIGIGMIDFAKKLRRKYPVPGLKYPVDKSGVWDLRIGTLTPLGGFKQHGNPGKYDQKTDSYVFGGFQRDETLTHFSVEVNGTARLIPAVNGTDGFGAVSVSSGDKLRVNAEALDGSGGKKTPGFDK